MALLKNFLINALLVLVSTIVTLTFIEAGLRYTRFADIPERSYVYPPDYFEASAELAYDIKKSSKEKIHNHREHPYTVFSNSFGCFDQERNVPDRYALILGDSLTWGYAPLNKKWTSKLEEMSQVFMLKCGVTGYGTLQELIKAKQVVKQVGKPPSHIIVLYVGNDLNDDYLFPQRTVYFGNLVSFIDNLDLETGKISRRTQEDIERIYSEYNENTLSNKLRQWRYGLVSYRLFRTKKRAFTKFIKGEFNTEETVVHDTIRPSAPDKSIKKEKIVKSSSNSRSEILPSGKTGATVYNVTLSRYLDTQDREWFNEAVEQHQNNLFQFMDFADSIGAKLLLIDANGALTHPRHQAVISRFDHSSAHSYYDLSSDYRTFITWKYDGHWNIEGNQVAAQYIFNHISESGFLK